ncbi:hypothetical protein Pst134EB_007994 [Puccinia striiformis f. sp. tritici]|nr:hypothetical protein Pst134EB_007994 [Puccinia striiformis f. sp. tritici]
MRYTSLPRTATFAWSPGPLLSSSQNQSSSASNNSNSEQQAEQDPFNSPFLPPVPRVVYSILASARTPSSKYGPHSPTIRPSQRVAWSLNLGSTV